VKASTIRGRSLYATKWYTFLDWEGLDYLNKHYAHEVAGQIKKGETVLGPFWLPGRKREKLKTKGLFYVLIGEGATGFLKDYFEKRRGCPQKGEPIWVANQKDGVRPLDKATMMQNWLNQLRRIGLVPKEKEKSKGHRTGFGGHETRDAASSLIHKAKLQGFDLDVAEFFKGHVRRLDPNKYDRFYEDEDWVKTQYKIIQPYLSILNPYTPSEAREVKGLREEIEELKFAIRMLQDASGLQVKKAPAEKVIE